jgi:hypothetical protein
MNMRFMTAVVLTVAMGDAALGQAPATDASLPGELDRISRRAVFFGHQSVGENVLQGLGELAAAQGMKLRIAAVPAADSVTPGMLGHLFIGENRNPQGKLRAFENAFRSRQGVDIAAMKFCYLDFDAKTDTQALFASYRSMINRIKERHPGIVFVHVTTPLTTVETGVKAFVKRVLGRPPYGALENQRRAEYNALLRREYGGREPVFDLARMESTNADGSPHVKEWDGRSAPALVSAYTDDGGHLNRAGRLRAARELVSVLAGIPQAAAPDLRTSR